MKKYILIALFCFVSTAFYSQKAIHHDSILSNQLNAFTSDFYTSNSSERYTAEGESIKN